MLAPLALAPIGLILLLMIGLRWSAARAGVAGLATTLGIALIAFGYGGAEPVPAVAGALLEALFVALTILWIILPALCIHELQTATGGVAALRRALERLSPDPRLMAILIAWFLALFLEGAAGFGTPIALTAPLLVGLGFRPVEAVTLALIGHAAGVSFGAVGTPVLPQVAATGLGEGAIAAGTGRLHALLGWILLILMVRVAAQRGAAAESMREIWAWTAVAAVAFLLPTGCSPASSARSCRRSAAPSWAASFSPACCAPGSAAMPRRRRRMAARRRPRATSCARACRTWCCSGSSS